MKWHTCNPDIIDDDPHDGDPPAPPIYYRGGTAWSGRSEPEPAPPVDDDIEDNFGGW
jgi:hypothetical protein